MEREPRTEHKQSKSYSLSRSNAGASLETDIQYTPILLATMHNPSQHPGLSGSRIYIIGYHHPAWLSPE